MKKGFTIVELMMVIGIIGILLGVVTTAAASSIKQARARKASACCQMVEQAFATYYAQKGRWPGSIGSQIASGSFSGGSNTEGVDGQSNSDKYVLNSSEISSMMTSTMDMLTVLLACIAGISLVVGGIGIMNIMYVSVTERTKEIGLRMSVGARGIDILSQFLIEAILISITGGVIGVLIGIGVSMLMKSLLHWPISIQAWTVLLSFLVCTVTGIFFGWYPAKKAANLDPIEAIRYE